MKVETILQSKGVAVHTVAAHARIAEAVKTLNEQRIGAVVVVDESGEVAGILSERDIVRRIDTDPNALLDRLVSDCMTRSVVTCTRDTLIDKVMEMMTQYRIRHIPVVENGNLIGIVSIGDVVKRKIEEAEQEAADLREYISSARR